MPNPGKIIFTSDHLSQSICMLTANPPRIYRITNDATSSTAINLTIGMHNIAIQPGCSADVSSPIINVTAMIVAGVTPTGSYEFIA